jgi:hypothetical protein
VRGIYSLCATSRRPDGLDEDLHVTAQRNESMTLRGLAVAVSMRLDDAKLTPKERDRRAIASGRQIKSTLSARWVRREGWRSSSER